MASLSVSAPLHPPCAACPHLRGGERGWVEGETERERKEGMRETVRQKREEKAQPVGTSGSNAAPP